MKKELTNRQYKEIRALIERGSARKKTGLFTGEGERFFEEIPESLIETVVVSGTYHEKHPDTDAYVLNDEAYRKLCDTKHPQGILAVIKKPETGKEAGISFGNDEGTAVVLEGIQDPGNLGTIIRTAEAAGAACVIMDRNTADIYSPKVVRSTMGSIFRVPFFYTDDLKETLTGFQKRGIKLYAADLSGEDMRGITLEKKRAFVIGNEGAGLSKEISDLCDRKIRIPMKGKVESLNAAVAAALLMYLE
ncbi:MAG: RNA methyltransferase [Lachnospiraceae bacterium]|nr:RNA methyltransferase [Lachnospiraceae bacterium]